MRNLKKFLALVLAMMMVFSMMVTVNASPSTSSDAASEAAAEQLENYKVLEGFDGSLQLPRPITRAQMAAIVYRIMTGDVKDADGNDNSITNFGSDADRYFTDVNTAAWARGYIGFCATQGILKGFGDNTVRPNNYITGYQVQAMLLRALGYGQDGEYEGSDWRYNVSTDSAKHSVYAITTGTNYDPDEECPRGIVAQMTLNASTKTSVVTYNKSSGQYSFAGYSLISEGNTVPDRDEWGVKIATTPYWFNWPDRSVPNSYDVEDTPLDEFYTAKTECDVAAAVSLAGNKTYTTYTNGDSNTGTQPIQSTDTVGTIGHNGRWTRVYSDYIVYVDFYLARVTGVIPRVTDEAGHTIRPASITAVAYTNATDNAGNAAKTAYPITISGASGYNVGDMIAVNIESTFNNNSINACDAHIVANGLQTETVTVDAMITSAPGTNNNNVPTNQPVGFIGTNGTRYLYNYTFGYNTVSATATLTGDDIGKTVTVYKDARGNVLGIDPAATNASYGVVTAIDAVRLSTGNYVAEFKVRTPDGETTIQAVDPITNKPFTTQAAADAYADGTAVAAPGTAAGIGMGALIKFVPTTGSYYAITKATATVSKTNNNANIADKELAILSGCAFLAPPSAVNSTPLVNDSTVFFIAQYAPDNTTRNNPNDYVLTGYDVVTGFQNIKDLGYKTGTQVDEDFNGTLDPVNGVDVVYFAAEDPDPDNNGESNALTDRFADYVLITSATLQKTDKVETVANYAYLMTDGQFVDVYDNYFVFKGVINGVANQELRVQRDNTVAANGLYTYSEWTNDGYEQVALSGNVIAADRYLYDDGVLIKGANSVTAFYAGGSLSAQAYLTVASDAQIYIINPTTGGSRLSDYDIGTTLALAVYGATSPVWYQLDEHGFIDYLYVVDTPEGGAGSSDTDGDGSTPGSNGAVDGGGKYADKDGAISLADVYEALGITFTSTSKTEITINIPVSEIKDALDSPSTHDQTLHLLNRMIGANFESMNAESGKLQVGVYLGGDHRDAANQANATITLSGDATKWGYTTTYNNGWTTDQNHDGEAFIYLDFGRMIDAASGAVNLYKGEATLKITVPMTTPTVRNQLYTIHMVCE